MGGDVQFDSTAGMEFEGTIPREMEYASLAEATRAWLQQQYPEDKIDITSEYYSWLDSGYFVTHYRDGYEDVYSIIPDRSLNAYIGKEPEIKGVEVTAPIMRSRSRAVVFTNLLDHLRNLGLKSRSETGEVHIHWGLPKDVTYSQLARIYRAVYNLTAIFREQFAWNPERGRSIDFLMFRSYVEQLEAYAKLHPNDVVDGENPEVLYKRAMMRVTKEYLTLELRIFNSILNKEVNMFSMDFTARLFSEAFKETSPLMDYLIETEDPELERVLELMGLGSDVAERVFTYSREKVENLKAAVSQRSQDRFQQRPTSRYILPNKSEEVMDQFWQNDFSIEENFAEYLREVKQQIPEEQISLAVFNLITAPDFQKLTESVKIQLLGEIRKAFDVDAYVESEIWAFEAVRRMGFGDQLKQLIQGMESEEPILLNSVIRQLLNVDASNPETIDQVITSLSADQKALDRFARMYQKYLYVSSTSVSEAKMKMLDAIIRSSKRAGTSLLSLEIIDLLKFQLQRRKPLAQSVFKSLTEVGREHPRILWGILSKVNGMLRNDVMGRIGYFSEFEELYAAVRFHLGQRNYPKLMVEWMVFMARAIKESTHPGLEQDLELVEEKLSLFGNEMTKNEHYELKKSVEQLVEKSDSPVADRLKKYYGID